MLNHTHYPNHNQTKHRNMPESPANLATIRVDWEWLSLTTWH